MQDNITSCSYNISHRESIHATGLHQNLNRAFVLFELTPANEISLLDPYERTLGKCGNDPLRPPRLSGGSAQTRKTPGKKKKNRLDTNRPSHGRTWPCGSFRSRLMPKSNRLPARLR